MEPITRTINKKTVERFGNISIIILVPFCILLAIGFNIYEESTPNFSFTVLAIAGSSIIVYPLIRGFFFLIAIGYKDIKHIKFRYIKDPSNPKYSKTQKIFEKRYSSIHCYCTKKMSIKSYKRAYLMPAVVLGIIPILLSIFYLNLTFLIFGGIYLIVGAEDFLIVHYLRDDRKGLVLGSENRYEYTLFPDE